MSVVQFNRPIEVRALRKPDHEDYIMVDDNDMPTIELLLTLV
jgi:hypothetical protein